MMNILGVAPKGVFSGFEHSFFDAIRKQGVRVDTFHVEMPFFKVLCTLKNIKMSKSKWGLHRDLAYHTSVEAFIKKSHHVQRYISQLDHKYDFIYQIGGLWNPISYGCEIPLVLSIDYTSLLSEKRNSEWKRKPGAQRDFWIKEEKALFDSASLICATTLNAKRSILEDYKVDPQKVIYVGPGVSYPYDKPDADRLPNYDSKRILFVGKGFKGKGLDTLLEAFRLIKTRVPDAILTIIGPAIEVRGDGVEYLGRIKDKQIVKEWYYKSAIFAMPSIFEPVGQVFLEAMSCKLPCIGTTLDAMPELIDNQVTGFTVMPGDAIALADALVKLLNEPSLCKNMGINGYDKLCSEFTWDVVGNKIVDNMTKCLSSI